VPVEEWKREAGIGRIPTEWTLAQVRAKTSRKKLKAVPVDPRRAVSSWQTATSEDIEMSAKLKGRNPYQARLGARVEPYGVFWLKFIEMRPDGLVVVENQHDRGKRKVRHVSDAIETDLIYPAVAGGDIVKYGTASCFPVLISQDPASRKGYDEDWMQQHVPLTYAYLKQFENVLNARAAYKKYFHREVNGHDGTVRQEPIAPFYSMYNVSGDSFLRYRVAWKRMASKLVATVLSTAKTPFGTKTLISTDTTSFFVAKNKNEAHYLCALVNSDVMDNYIRSFSSGGRGFGAPSIMKNIAIPEFDSSNDLHMHLSRMSQDAHAQVAKGKDIGPIEKRINDLTRELWNIKR